MEINKIYNMDCVEALRQLDEQSIDLVVTSPPYDNLRSYSNNIDKVWCENIWKQIMSELYRVMKNGGIVVWVVGDATINGTETGTSFKQALYAKEIGFNLFDTMIFEKKPRGAVGSNKTYWQTFEYMFVFSKGTPKTINLIKDRKNADSRKGDIGTKRLKNGELKRVFRAGYGEFGRRTNIWRYSIGKSAEEYSCNWHPATFPYRLASDHILSWSNEGDIVLDPFMGSGTTALAAIKLRRKYIGFELNKEYYEKVLKRLNDETAQLSLF